MSRASLGILGRLEVFESRLFARRLRGFFCCSHTICPFWFYAAMRDWTAGGNDLRIRPVAEALSGARAFALQARGLLALERMVAARVRLIGTGRAAFGVLGGFQITHFYFFFVCSHFLISFVCLLFG